VNNKLAPGAEIAVRATSPDGTVNQFSVRVRIDTPVELEYYRNGGILQSVLRKLLRAR
jgi:aconitate hydratase